MPLFLQIQSRWKEAQTRVLSLQHNQLFVRRNMFLDLLGVSSEGQNVTNGERFFKPLGLKPPARGSCNTDERSCTVPTVHQPQ